MTMSSHAFLPSDCSVAIIMGTSVFSGLNLAKIVLIGEPSPTMSRMFNTFLKM